MHKDIIQAISPAEGGNSSPVPAKSLTSSETYRPQSHSPAALIVFIGSACVCADHLYHLPTAAHVHTE